MIAAAPTLAPARVGESLRRAIRDFYEESWRLVVLNSLLSAYVLVVLAVAIYAPLALVLLVGAGPLAAMLVSAAATVVDEGSLSFNDAVTGFRQNWRRGLVLAAAVLAAGAASVFALGFYAGAGPFAWPLAVLVLYLGGIFALHQLLLWPVAVRSRRPLVEDARTAAVRLVRRPAATTGLGLALLVVNLAGLVAGVLPFLTMTIAYSALAAARFARAETGEEA